MKHSQPTAALLDSSIARKILHGDTNYQEYLDKAIPLEKRHVSAYIRMELLRGFLLPLIELYCSAEMSHIKTADDALKLWAEGFDGRKIKFLLSMIGQITAYHQINLLDNSHKPRFLTRLLSVINQYSVVIDQIGKDTGQDRTDCGRASVSYHFDQDNLAQSIKSYGRRFNAVEDCRSKCHIDRIIKVTFAEEISIWIDRSNTIDKSEKGFHDLVEKMRVLREKDASKFTCHQCKTVGDMIIALDAPKITTLHHLDASFIPLCELIDKPHQVHPSAKAHNDALAASSLSAEVT